MDISLPPGYTLRPAALVDLEASVRMVNAVYKDLVGEPDLFSTDEFRTEWETPGFDLETDTCVVIAPDGGIAGYLEVWDLLNPSVRVFLWGHTHPAHRGRGVGTALVRYAKQRAAHAVERAPQEARVVLQTSILHGNLPAAELVQSQGMVLIRHMLRMVIDFPQPPAPPQIPQGIILRTMRAGEEEEEVIRTLRDSFKDHWNYVLSSFEEEMQRWRHYMQTSDEFDPSLWFVAEEAGYIAGISLCRPKCFDNPQMGWVGSLGVRPKYRRRGIALALLQHSFADFYRRGIRSVGLGVDAQNLTGATRLYTRAGMHSDPLKMYDFYEKELRPGIDLSTQTQVEQPEAAI